LLQIRGPKPHGSGGYTCSPIHWRSPAVETLRRPCPCMNPGLGVWNCGIYRGEGFDSGQGTGNIAMHRARELAIRTHNISPATSNRLNLNSLQPNSKGIISFLIVIGENLYAHAQSMGREGGIWQDRAPGKTGRRGMSARGRKLHQQ
jgi:hypothetical protein